MYIIIKQLSRVICKWEFSHLPNEKSLFPMSKFAIISKSNAIIFLY